MICIYQYLVQFESIGFLTYIKIMIDGQQIAPVPTLRSGHPLGILYVLLFKSRLIRYNLFPTVNSYVYSRKHNVLTATSQYRIDAIFIIVGFTYTNPSIQTFNSQPFAFVYESFIFRRHTRFRFSCCDENGYFYLKKFYRRVFRACRIRLTYIRFQTPRRNRHICFGRCVMRCKC